MAANAYANEAQARSEAAAKNYYRHRRRALRRCIAQWLFIAALVAVGFALGFICKSCTAAQAADTTSTPSTTVKAGAAEFSGPSPTEDAVAAPAPQPSSVQLIHAYILSVSPHCKDASLAAKYLADAARESGVDWRLLAAMARYESTFNIHALGSAGERGLLQVHPCHRARFAKAGLDWNSARDQVRFAACVMLAPNMDKGLRAALRPWAVRPRALKEYARLQKRYANDELDEPPMDRL